MRPQNTLILLKWGFWGTVVVLLLASQLFPVAATGFLDQHGTRVAISIMLVLLLALIAAAAFAIRDKMAKRALVGRHGLVIGSGSDVRPRFQFELLFERNVAIKNVFCGEEGGVKVYVFDRIVWDKWADYEGQEGETCYAAECRQWRFPNLAVLPEGTVQRLVEQAVDSFRPIEVNSMQEAHRFEAGTSFWKEYYVDAMQKDMDQLLTPSLIDYFERHLGLALEIRPEQMLIYYPEITLATYQVPEFIQECQTLQGMISDSFA